MLGQQCAWRVAIAAAERLGRRYRDDGHNDMCLCGRGHQRLAHIMGMRTWRRSGRTTRSYVRLGPHPDMHLHYCACCSLVSRSNPAWQGSFVRVHASRCSFAAEAVTGSLHLFGGMVWYGYSESPKYSCGSSGQYQWRLARGDGEFINANEVPDP